MSALHIIAACGAISGAAGLGIGFLLGFLFPRPTDIWRIGDRARCGWDFAQSVGAIFAAAGLCGGAIVAIARSVGHG